MATTLPQFDDNAEARAAELRDRRLELSYDYDRFTGIAMLPSVPRWARPDLAWLAQVADVIAQIAVNATRIDGRLSRMHPEHPEHHAFRELVVADENGGVKAAFQALVDIVEGEERGTDRAESLSDFEALFVSLPLPASAHDFQDDRTFARMRVAGPNPMVLRRIERLPGNFAVTEADVARARAALDAQAIDVEGFSLEAALREGRAFLADYRAVAGLELGTWEGGAKYMEAPLALFFTAGAERALLPVAVQIAQDPGPDAPILTPADGVRWAMAKTLVTVADGNLHQAVAHLGHTHLVIEACAIAAYRNLAEAHPVHQLLAPHFEGTFYINDAAETTLTKPGGAVDKLMAAKIEVSREVAAQSVLSWDFTATMLERELRERGVDDPHTLPDYPYRDDARLVRGAIRDWVECYLRIWYRNDEAVRQDREIQAMFRELGAKDGGRIPGVPAITSVWVLTEALTHIIFTGSAQHAAVNFPQRPIMSYAPAFPLAGFRAAPGPEETYANWLALLPPLQLAELQLGIGTLLGGVQHTKLGRYEVGIFRSFAHDSRTEEPLRAFQARLEEIERVITLRNEGRTPYTYLLPSKIPQSINI